MKMGSAARITKTLLFGLSLFLLGGCGYKNAPVPPETVVPQPINDLLYKTDDTSVQLSWSYPVKTIRGAALDDISAFELYRAEIPLEEYCSTCPIPFNTAIELNGGPTYDGKERRKAHYQSSQLQPGYKYFFKVRSRTSWWASSADSNTVTFVWFPPAAAPQGVIATPGDSQVILKWQPVMTLKDGSPIKTSVKYQVLRSLDGNVFGPVGEPVAATEYVDHQVNNGTKYFYTIQSKMVLENELVSGATSKQVTVVPVDLTPPAAPTGVTVVRTDVGTKIFWDKNPASDIGGYKVYRRPAGRNSFKLLGQVEPVYTLFVDKKAEGSVLYYYAVTAIDQANPPNESKKSKEVTAKY